MTPTLLRTKQIISAGQVTSAGFSSLNLFIRVVLFALLIMMCRPVARAQLVPSVRIDPHSRAVQQTAPFDRPFYLLLPVDTALQLDELRQLTLYESSRKLRSKQLLGKTLADYDDVYLKTAYFVDTPKEAGFKYLKVFINQQLQSNTRFSVILYLNASASYLDQFDKINMELYRGDVAKAKQDYHELAKDLTVNHSFGKIRTKWEPFDKGENDTIYSQKAIRDGDSYHQDFLDSFLPLYQQLSQEDTAILNNLTRLKDSLKSSPFKWTDLFNCNCEKDFVANELFQDSTKFLIPLHNLLNVTAALPYFASGRLSIQDFEPYDVVKENELGKRIDNLGRLKASLLSISYFFHLSSYASRIPPPTQKNIYNYILPVLSAIDQRMNTLKGLQVKIRSALNDDFSIFSAELSFGIAAPFGQDIKTAAGNYIIPDFGVAAAGTFVNNQYGTSVLPYLGVNFSLIPVDKSIPLRDIKNKRLLHYMSFVLGLTTTALSRQGTYDLISNMSLVGGLACRISRGFRVTGGVLVYKRNNANPVLAQRVTVGPLLALSLDLDIANWIGDLKKIF